MEALRQGFNTVFPMDKLGDFTPNEVSFVRQMLLVSKLSVVGPHHAVRGPGHRVHQGGDHEVHRAQALLQQGISWVLKICECVLVEIRGTERKAFMQFTIGCSSLPPGDLANLHPRYFTKIFFNFNILMLCLQTNSEHWYERLMLQMEASRL